MFLLLLQGVLCLLSYLLVPPRYRMWRCAITYQLLCSKDGTRRTRSLGQWTKPVQELPLHKWWQQGCGMSLHKEAKCVLWKDCAGSGTERGRGSWPYVHSCCKLNQGQMLAWLTKLKLWQGGASMVLPALPKLTWQLASMILPWNNTQEFTLS